MSTIKTNKDSNNTGYIRIQLSYYPNPTPFRKHIEDSMPWRMYVEFDKNFGINRRVFQDALNEPRKAAVETLLAFAKALECYPWNLVKDFGMSQDAVPYSVLEKFQKAYQNEIKHS